MAKRIKTGDIVEIPTSEGLGYAIYTHRDAQWGALLRVLRGVFPERPADLASLLVLPEQFSAFFPLAQAVNQGIVSIVGTASVPTHWLEFPVFRSGQRDQSGRVHDWWLWDGQRQWRVGSLTPDQYHYPLRQVINDTLLIERIESGWTASLET